MTRPILALAAAALLATTSTTGAIYGPMNAGGVETRGPGGRPNQRKLRKKWRQQRSSGRVVRH